MYEEMSILHPWLQKKFTISFMLLLILVLLSACGTKEENSPNKSESTSTSNSDVVSSDENPIVTITMKDDTEIELELYPQVAPNTVNNFISLVKEGFYDGLTFHRVIPGFMVQGGDPDGKGTGGPGYAIKGEFSSNGYDNALKHERGVISMARAQMPDSAGSQFFIMVADAPHLDGEYASFGKVIKGMEIVDDIVAVKRDSADKPLKDVVMKKVTVDTKGTNYPDPEKE